MFQKSVCAFEVVAAKLGNLLWSCLDLILLNVLCFAGCWFFAAFCPLFAFCDALCDARERCHINIRINNIVNVIFDHKLYRYVYNYLYDCVSHITTGLLSCVYC